MPLFIGEKKYNMLNSIKNLATGVYQPWKCLSSACNYIAFLSSQIPSASLLYRMLMVTFFFPIFAIF